MIEDYVAESVYRPTPGQEETLLHDFENSDSRVNSDQTTVDLVGLVDKRLLQEALQQLANRHDLLRIDSPQGKAKHPALLLAKNRAVTLEFQDLSGLAAPDKEPAVAGIRSQLKQAGFDLQKDPLIRATLVKRENLLNTFIFDYHRLVTDGWGVGFLLADLVALYLALQGSSVSKPEVILSDGCNLRCNTLQAAMYWQQLLADYEQTSSLPHFKRSGSPPEYLRGEWSAELGQERSDRLRELAARNRISSRTVLQACWALLLALYNGTNDVVFGVRTAWRTQEYADPSTITHINTLPVRVRLGKDCVIRDLLLGLQEQVTHSGQFELSDLADIQEAHSLGNHLLDHVLSFAPQRSDSGLVLECRGRSAQVPPHFGLTFGAESNILLTYVFNQRLYDKSSIALLQQQFCHVLDQIASDEQRLVRNVSALDSRSRNRILEEFNPPATEFPQNICVHDLFQQQAARAPEHPAVVSPAGSLTYRELNTRANQLARVLRKKGVLPDHFVAIVADRSLEMMIAILAVWKAGGAYLPIDPDYPLARKQYLLKTASVRLLLTQSALIQEHLRLLWDVGEILAIDDPSHYQGDETDLASAANPRHLAYALFTSGTTGNPKGVMIEHRSVVNLLLAQRRTFGVTAEERILQFSSFCFDASVEQIGLAWSSGATLVLLDKSTLLDPRKFAAYVRDQGVTHVHAVPSFLETIELEDDHRLRRLIAGGDTCPPALAHKWRPKCAFYNEYGPTETTVTSVEYRVDSLTGNDTSLPIGSPLANTYVYLLDNAFQPVPIGAPGRMYIGGVGVARGYLNQPELTARVFLDNPFRSGEKMYDTGDYARWLPDGLLEFLGRKDNQVKIRGFRIELAEIEGALGSAPGVRSCVVALNFDEGKQPVLCGYYTANELLDERVLRAHLAGKLPAYMIPAFFARIEEVPLNINGKVDRSRLPTPTLRKQTGLAAPRTGLECKLRDLWAELLGVEPDRIGLHTPFCELGGHSLKAIFLVARIHRDLEVEIPIHEFFKAPTIAGLARAIGKARASDFTSIAPADPRPFYPATAAQKGVYRRQMLEPESTSFNLSALFRLRGDIQANRLRDAVAAVVGRHASLRTSFQLREGELVQTVLEAPVPAVLEHRVGEDAEVQSFARNFKRPFDLSKAPLLRMALLTTGTDTHVLVVDAHPIVCDGVSLDVIVRETLSLYAGVPCPALRLQYPDYAVWLERPEQQAAIQRQREFWMAQLAGGLPTLALPLDYPRPDAPSLEGSCDSFDLGALETAALEQLAAANHCTLYIVLVAALSLFLSRVTGKEEVLLGTPIAGRRHTDLQNVVGLFQNTLVLRSSTGDPARPFTEFLAEIRERTFAAFENQDVAFEGLADSAFPAGRTNPHPLFAVMFEFGISDPNLVSIPGLAIEPCPQTDVVARCDLSFACVKQGDHLHIDVKYSSGLFLAATIARFIDDFRSLVGDILARPDASLRSLGLAPQRVRAAKLFDASSEGALAGSRTPTTKPSETPIVSRKHPLSLISEGSPVRNNTKRGML